MSSRPLPRGQLYFDPAATLADLALGFGGRGGPGPETRTLELLAARTFGAKHAVMLGHARLALEALLAELALPSGAEILMTPVTIPDVVNVVLDAGLVPVWVDLEPRTANVDVDDLAAKVGRKSRAILITHLCGLPSRMDAVMALADEKGLVVLEDASQATGAAWDGKACGTFGRAGFFSLTTLKTVSSFTGGLVLTDDAGLDAGLRAREAGWPVPPPGTFRALYARDLVLHAASHPAVYGTVGHRLVGALERVASPLVVEFQRGNLLGRTEHAMQIVRRALPAKYRVRYTDLQAAMASRALDRVEAGNARRRALADHLLGRLDDARLEGGPLVPPEATPVWWRFPYWSDRTEALRIHLRARGVDSARTNLICASATDAFASLAAPTPEALRYKEGMIFLPIHPSMDLEDMDRIADALEDFER